MKQEGEEVKEGLGGAAGGTTGTRESVKRGRITWPWPSPLSYITDHTTCQCRFCPPAPPFSIFSFPIINKIAPILMLQ